MKRQRTGAIGLAVIGLGWMGEVHSRCFRLVPDRFAAYGIQTRLITCVDELKERARQARDRFGFEEYATDWREALTHPEVEAVSIATPNHLHLPIAKSAAEAGKHIFCEKPVGRNPKETAEIESSARHAGVLTGVGYNYRWAPLVQYAHQLVSGGRLGRLTHYRGRFFAGYGSDPDSVLSWRFRSEMAGLGTLGDLLSHVIDMAHTMTGPIRRVTSGRETFIRKRPLPSPGVKTHFDTHSGGPRGDVDNEDYVGVLVEFEQGARGTLEACRVINGAKCEMAFEINGTEGALKWDFERMNELELFLPRTGGSDNGFIRVVGGPEHPFHGLFHPGPGIGLGYEDLKLIEAFQFLNSISEGRQGQPGFREALAVARVQDAILRSWESGAWEEVAQG